MRIFCLSSLQAWISRLGEETCHPTILKPLLDGLENTHICHRGTSCHGEELPGQSYKTGLISAVTAK